MNRLRWAKPTLNRTMVFTCGVMTMIMLVVAVENAVLGETVQAIGYLFSAGAIAVLGLFAR